MSEHQSEEKSPIQILRAAKKKQILDVDLSGGVIVSINDFEQSPEELAELKEAIILEIRNMEVGYVTKN